MGNSPFRDNVLDAWIARAGTVLDAYEPIPSLHQNGTKDVDDGGFDDANRPEYVRSSPRSIFSQGVLQRETAETEDLD